jgi:hypothetical protein
VMDYLMFFKTRQWALDRTGSFVTDLESKTVRPILLENLGSLTCLHAVV